MTFFLSLFFETKMDEILGNYFVKPGRNGRKATHFSHNPKGEYRIIESESFDFWQSYCNIVKDDKSKDETLSASVAFMYRKLLPLLKLMFSKLFEITELATIPTFSVS